MDIIPDMYQKDIFSINYDKLKKLGIKTIAFDFDNTIIEPNEKELNIKIVSLIKKIKKDFNVIVISNSIRGRRVKKFCNQFDTKYILFARKPWKVGFKKALSLHSSKPKEICMVGDQYFTDIIGAKKMGYYAILIDQIGPHENIFAKKNRLREKYKYKKINFIKGRYYD